MRVNASHRIALLVTIGVAAAVSEAQDSSSKPAVNTITGVVREAGSGRPVEGARVVSMLQSGSPPSAAGGRFAAETDSEGRYSLTGFPIGEYTVYVLAKGRGMQKSVSIAAPAGVDAKLDFEVVAQTAIAGRVEDEHGQPLPGIKVSLITREYEGGVLRLSVKNVVTTTDDGSYEFTNVDPDRAWLIRAEAASIHELPVSRVPLNPKTRKRALVTTWYPGMPDSVGSTPITVKAGTRREGVDIRLLSSPNVCIAGLVEADGRPAALGFMVQDQAASNGQILGETGPDGKFRICNLYPGEYRITAGSIAGRRHTQGAFLGRETVLLGKRDATDVRVDVRPAVSIAGTAGFDEDPSQRPDCDKVSLTLMPLARYPIIGESLAASSSLPGRFSLGAIFRDDYVLAGFVTGAGCYIKDITYMGSSVLREPLRGSRIDTAQELHVVVGFNGASLRAVVKDADGKGLPDVNVVAIPEGADSEAQLATSLKRFRTDQTGTCNFGTLAPGKYRVLATPDPIDLTPESLRNLMQVTAKATEIELRPRQGQSLSLSPTRMQ